MKQNKELNQYNRIPRYGLRKLSIGLASALLGTVITAGITTTAHAAETDTPTVETHQSDAGSIVSQKSVTLTSPVKDKMAPQTANTATDSDSPVSVETPADQVTTPTESEYQAPKQEKQIDIVPIQTTVGQVPDPKAAFANWNHSAQSISADDPDMFAVSWDQQPDVAKVGQVTAKLKVSYGEYNEQTDQPVQTSEIVDVPVIVTFKEQTVDNTQTNAGDERVTNTVQFINAKTGKIIRVDKYIGDKDSSAESWDNAIDSGTLKAAINYAGYQLSPNNNISLSDVLQLGETDQFFSIYLDPVDDNQGEEPADHAKVKPVLRDSLADFYVDFTKGLPDPAIFIANYDQLPAGTTVSWKVKPTYVKQDDDTYDTMPTNYPVIEVNDGQHVTDFGGTADSPLNILTMLLMSDEHPAAKGTVKVLVNGTLPSFKDIVIPAASVATNFPYDSYYWVVKPDLSHAGVTYGAYTSTEYPTTSYLMVRVVAPVNQNETRTVKRTIHYDVTGTGHAIIADQVQNIGYTRTKTVNPIDNSVISTGKWTTASSQFPCQEVEQIPGFDSYIDGVKGTAVAPATVKTATNGEPQDGATITITYKKTPKPVTPVQDTTVTYVFYDDTANQSIAGGTSVTGRPGMVRTVSLAVPAGYQLAAGQTLPTSVTMPRMDQTITIHLVHATQPITPGDPDDRRS